MRAKGTTVIALTEKEFQAQVVALAKTLGYRVYHTYFSIRSERGWPDLAIVGRGRLILAELKAEKGKLTPAQTSWLESLNECEGVTAYCWRPSDWDSVVAVLSGRVFGGEG